jgi:hypothetical protein
MFPQCRAAPFLTAAILVVASLPSIAAVNQATGNYFRKVSDYANVGEPLLSVSRTYNSITTLAAGPLGPGWTMQFLSETLLVKRPVTTVTDTYGPYISSYDALGAPVEYYIPQTYNRTGRATLTLSDGKSIVAFLF